MEQQQANAQSFHDIVHEITEIGIANHAQAIIEHAQNNFVPGQSSLKQLEPLSEQKYESGIVISAGPSVHNKESIQRILAADYKGTIVAVDGAYIKCLKLGLIPDYVVTLDPHPTRMVRWFGDHDFEYHSEKDDYFNRQDLDVEFRKNSIEQNQEHIEMVNTHGYKTKAIIASTAPANVVERVQEANMSMYWWNPLVDDPNQPESMTRKIYAINKFSCMNTGGTVGTASWVFAHSILKLKHIAVIGMDLGYYTSTPIEQTQTYYELIKHIGDEHRIQECFQRFEFPLTKEEFYTDPTYFWYRKNFLELLTKAQRPTYNCTEAGTLFGENIECVNLSYFLNKFNLGV